MDGVGGVVCGVVGVMVTPNSQNTSLTPNIALATPHNLAISAHAITTPPNTAPIAIESSGVCVVEPASHTFESLFCIKFSTVSFVK
jgi:hypothetical protein